MKPTPEQRAEKRYPHDLADQMELENNAGEATNYVRSGYSTCIREEVEPREAEVERLRALVQTLVNAICLPIVSVEAKTDHIKQGQDAIATAKEQGFLPSTSDTTS